jgi:hypothetical protein
MAIHRILSLAAIVAAGLFSCSAPRPESHNPLEAAPIDSARIGSVDSVATWAYRRETSADLDGDGAAERVILTADVELGSGGVPLWEDGHRWALVVESARGERTLVYGAFVPNGFAEAAVLAADSQGRRRVLVQERTPQQLRSLEVEYGGPGEARARSAAHYPVGEWLPGSASLR